MYKIIDNSFNFKEAKLTIIIPQMIKSASANDPLRDIKPEPGYTKVLALFLGAGEFYGDNQNGDFFTEKDLKKYCPTFVQYGKVYMHHENKDPSNNYGYVEKVWYNERMHRVEGVMCLRHDRCENEIRRINNGENIPVSMACRVKFDVCSICGNKARTMDQYCVHLNHELRKIYEDGRKVYAINPDPIFFDISIVFRPADRTAYTLKKVASRNAGPTPSALLGERKFGRVVHMEKTSSYSRTKEALRKISELEKSITPVLVGRNRPGHVSDDARCCSPDRSPIDGIHDVVSSMPDLDEGCISLLKRFPIEKVVKVMGDHDMMPSLKDFLGLIGQEDMMSDVKEVLPNSISRLLNKFDSIDGDIDFSCDTGPEDSQYGFIKDILEDYMSEKSLNSSNIKDKVMVIRLSGKPRVKRFKTDNGQGVRMEQSSGNIIIKKSSKKNVADTLANLYNLCKVSCLRRDDRVKMLTLICSNY